MTQVLIGLGFATVLAVIGALILFGRNNRQAGETKVIADVATDAVDVISDMADAQANAPQGKGEIVKRLREKGL